MGDGEDHLVLGCGRFRTERLECSNADQPVHPMIRPCQRQRPFRSVPPLLAFGSLSSHTSLTICREERDPGGDDGEDTSDSTGHRRPGQDGSPEPIVDDEWREQASDNRADQTSHSGEYDTDLPCAQRCAALPSGSRDATSFSEHNPHPRIERSRRPEPGPSRGELFAACSGPVILWSAVVRQLQRSSGDGGQPRRSRRRRPRRSPGRRARGRRPREVRGRSSASGRRRSGRPRAAG